MKWLFLVHQIKTLNSRERVKVWRLTKKVGAVLYRNSVYVLPDGKERNEDFQWLCQQIRDCQGEASVFVSASNDQKENRTLKALFNRTREFEYQALGKLAEKVSQRIHRAIDEGQVSESLRKSLSKEIAHLELTFFEIEKIDFFGAPSKRKVRTLIGRTKEEMESADATATPSPAPAHHDRKMFRRQTWVTRKNIHIDRLCSAWLIHKFIDPEAKFIFAAESQLPKNAIPFDVFGVEFSHHGEDCTFETLLKSFRIKDKALNSLAQIIHDIDMKDHKFERPEAAGVDIVVRSLSDSMQDDHKVLAVGSVMLDALYSRLAKEKVKQ
ncbi:MAG TPA: chromate resistance protein ChrB domain-containing protein [bacterium]